MMKEMDNRAYNAGEGTKDSPASIQRAGGEDPRRYDAAIVIDRKVRDNDMSGYNHNATSVQPANEGNENVMWARERDVKSAAQGTPNPDGTRS
jgi:hypothetical protein